MQEIPIRKSLLKIEMGWRSLYCAWIGAACRWNVSADQIEHAVVQPDSSLTGEQDPKVDAGGRFRDSQHYLRFYLYGLQLIQVPNKKAGPR